MYSSFVLLILMLSAVSAGPCPAPLPEGCRCLVDSRRILRSVNCTGQGLTRFPDVAETVRTLDISHNDIAVLKRQHGRGQYGDLLTLKLNNCGIRRIEDGFFEQFPAVNTINLRYNKLSEVPSTYTHSYLLLDLSYNNIRYLNTFNGSHVSALYLDYNKLNSIPATGLNNLLRLQYLSIRNNNISSVNHEALTQSLTHLSIGDNKLTKIPQLKQLKYSLLSLAMDYNHIASLENLPYYTNLQNCTLVSNKISSFATQTTNSTSSISVLFLTKNNMDLVCEEDLLTFPNLTILDLSENAIEYIPDKCFSGLRHIQSLELSYNLITDMSFTALKNLNQLKICNLRNNRMKVFVPSLKTLTNLRSLDLTSNYLTEFPYIPPSLYLLYIADNRIPNLPLRQLRDAATLVELDLSNNEIAEIEEGVMQALPHLQKLYLSGNNIATLTSLVLSNNPRLNYLDLSHNQLEAIPDNYFNNTIIKTLDISHNHISAITDRTLAGIDGILTSLDASFNVDLDELSHIGLSAVKTLNLDGNEQLLTKLPRSGLRNLREVTVPFPVMCCWFRKIKKQSVEVKEPESADLKVIRGYWDDNLPIDSRATLITPDPPSGNTLPTTGPWHGTRLVTPSGTTGPYTSSFTRIRVSGPTTTPPLRRLRRDLHTTTYSTSFTSGFVRVEEVSFEDLVEQQGNATVKTLVSVEDTGLRCYPEPDEFNPCEDLIGNWVLRLGVWMVCSMAVIGNLTLFFVTLLSTKKFTPTRFLILNLSFSDLFTGIYLTMLAVVDAKTYGVYEDFAMDWQNGIGCKIAGFMVTFSSELSMYTLTVISVERMVTIIHYSNPYKHLKTRHVAVAMLVGWMISVTAGVLPLLNVSSYSRVAICLPFQKETIQDFGLIMSLMVVNTVAVSIIIYSYLTIFCNVRHLQKPLDNADFRETLRMSLIIITDIICWVPIVICGVSAAFGSSLITTSNAKILVVFFLPLNACANPFLYSLSRPGFKKDLLYLLSKLGMCQQAYYINSRRKSGMDLEIKKKLQDLKELRKPSQDSTGSSGYSSEAGFPKQPALMSLIKHAAVELPE